MKTQALETIRPISIREFHDAAALRNLSQAARRKLECAAALGCALNAFKPETIGTAYPILRSDWESYIPAAAPYGSTRQNAPGHKGGHCLRGRLCGTIVPTDPRGEGNMIVNPVTHAATASAATWDKLVAWLWKAYGTAAPAPRRHALAA